MRATNEPTLSSVEPFDCASGAQYVIYHYKNIPPFLLTPGDKIIFFSNDPLVDTPKTGGIAMTQFGGNNENNYVNIVNSKFAFPSSQHIEFIVDNLYNFPGGDLLLRFRAPTGCDYSYSAKMARRTDSSG